MVVVVTMVLIVVVVVVLVMIKVVTIVVVIAFGVLVAVLIHPACWMLAFTWLEGDKRRLKETPSFAAVVIARAAPSRVIRLVVRQSQGPILSWR